MATIFSPYLVVAQIWWTSAFCECLVKDLVAQVSSSIPTFTTDTNTIPPSITFIVMSLKVTSRLICTVTPPLYLSELYCSGGLIL